MGVPEHPYRPLIERVCQFYPPVTPDILEAMCIVESGMDPHARSASGARGLTQIIPRLHAATLGVKVADQMGVPLTDALWDDPEFSLRAGARHLAWLYTADDAPSWERAVRAYHSGSYDPPTGFRDGQGTSSDQHIAKFRRALADVQALRSQQGTTTMTTYGNVPMFGYYDRQFVTANKPEGVGWNNLGLRDILGLVLHRMLGSLTGTDTFFRTAEALTDYGIGVAATDGNGLAGVIYKWNDPLGYRAGWASGPVSAPYGDGLAFVNKYGINAVNKRLVSLEISGQAGTPIDAFTYNEIIHFIAWHADQAKISWEQFPLNPATGISFLFFHEEMTIGTGKRCPFEVVKALIDQIITDVKAFLRKYQETAVPVPTPQPQPQPAPDGIGKGAWVRFTDALNVRIQPDLADVAWNGKPNLIATLPAGTIGQIINGPFSGDGHTWFDIEMPGFGTGHVAADWLERTEAPRPEPIPEPQYARPVPVTELAMYGQDDADTARSLVLVNGTDFVWVNDRVRAVRDTPRLQYAYKTAKHTGPVIKAGEEFDVLWFFKAGDGTYYYLTPWWTRIIADDVERIKD